MRVGERGWDDGGGKGVGMRVGWDDGGGMGIGMMVGGKGLG
jgi:hypothetical protein